MGGPILLMSTVLQDEKETVERNRETAKCVESLVACRNHQMDEVNKQALPIWEALHA